MELPVPQTRAGLSSSFQHPPGIIRALWQLPLPRLLDSCHDRGRCSCSSHVVVGADNVWRSRPSRAKVHLRVDLKALAAFGGGARGWGWQELRPRGSWKANAGGGAKVECSSAGNEAFQQGGMQEWPQNVTECLAGTSQWEVLHLQQDLGVMGLVLGGAFLWVKVFGYFTKQDLVERKLSRKLVHISSGLLYLACWPLFSVSPWARFVAALVPLANIVRFLITGLGVRKNEGLVSSMSREGDPKELLRGPFYYVIVLMLCAIVFWRDSPVGMIALAMMCGGDGVADIVGRRYGALKLPYNAEKSWAGSVAMCTFGFLVSLGFLYYFSACGFIQLNLDEAVPRVAFMALSATVVESLPLTTKYDDNITVPLTTVLLGVVLFPSQIGGM